MADPTKRDGETGRVASDTDDADLSARLDRLDARLGAAKGDGDERREPRSAQTSDSGAFGQAVRLSAEFVSGVVAGGLLGWLVDRLFGSTPWGLIVCLLLGFCAGMLNLMRASGMAKPARTKTDV
jgi:ATP synthase protein I